MYIDNNWYGNRFVLSKYCKTNDKPTIASIQHGLFFPESLPKNKNLKKTFNTPWLVWNKNLEKHLKKLGIKNVISIGSPFIYANEIYKSVIYFLKNPKLMDLQVKKFSKILNGIKSKTSSSIEASKILDNYLI